jgi:hypothetical protein
MGLDEVAALAEEFWERVGFREPFPRDLERVLVLSTPAFPVRLPGLCPSAARHWLSQRGISLPLSVPDRPLDGCIVAYRGHAVIFVEEGLPPDHGRAVLAHEFAHFLADYQRPRERAVRRLGPSLLPVLDGERPATAAEELAGALAGVTLGAHVHYMERSFDPSALSATDRVERRADALACELLAPRAAVCAAVGEGGRLPREARPSRRVLRERFGLPGRWAAAHAGRLARAARRQRTFSDLLGL